MTAIRQHFGDYTAGELSSFTPEQLIEIIIRAQSEDNFILMTDSYKQTHHLLYPKKLQQVYSYLESRGGEMPYSVFFGLQYYIKKYLAGVRITKEKIEEAREKNIKHFGFDCFDDTMWNHILENHGGRLPLEIKAVKEGKAVGVKNILMSIVNTDPECAALTNITETLLMKLWAPNTIAAYGRIIKTLISKYHAITSDLPVFLVNFQHHDFGYRGVSSEESARILGAAGLSTGFLGTDTLGAISFAERYYHEPMAGFSVIASEHSVMCSYGGKTHEREAYRQILLKVKQECANVNPASGVIILSLVSDTYNIYNVCKNILPSLKDEFIGWTNNNGIPIKIVVRPDSGDARKVLFGSPAFDATDNELVSKLSIDMNITALAATELVEKGIFEILFEEFGSSVNSKGYRVFHPQIGVLQGDGVSFKTIVELFHVMLEKKIDIMMLVFGSGGKYLQAHDRDEQKFAIKATHVIIDFKNIDIKKSPITDSGKNSKTGYLKLVQTGRGWKDYITVSSHDADFDKYDDELVTVFYNGELLVDYTFAEVRENCAIEDWEYELLAA